MTQEQILEGNKLIAEFMGYIVYNKRYPRNHGIGGGISIYVKETILQKLKYHKSWEELMPVVEKIEEINDKHHGHFGIYIHSNCCNIQGTNLWESIENPEYGSVYMSDPNAIFPTKIESTWYNIVQFIKWYNEYSKKDPSTY